MKNDPAFAIVRIDTFQDRDEARVTVNRVVWEQQTAESEVQRLNLLNAAKGSRYFLQPTRVERRD